MDEPHESDRKVHITGVGNHQITDKQIVKKLAEYYCSRFNWNTRLCQKIDWAIFSSAYKNRIKKNFWWANKFHLQKLPPGERMQKRGGCEDERCCSCGASLETDDHLFQCPSRPQFKRRLLATINDMKSKIDPGLYFVLYDGVANYINNHEKSSPNNIPENATEQQRKRQRDRTNTDLTSFSPVSYTHLTLPTKA